MRAVSARSAVTGFSLLAFGIILLRTAWISDLAYLTIRTVEHAASGYGPRWNIAERVQVDDHPLWLALLLVGRLTIGGSYVATMAVSVACSLAGVWMLLRQAASDETTVFVAAAASLSPLFVAFSTSGLETPLLHLLVAGVVVVAFGAERSGPRPMLLGVFAGLALLTRWTTVWLVAPILLAALRHVEWRARARAMAIAVVPSLTWLVWSVWYYGTIGPIGWMADRSAGPLWRDRIDLGTRFLAESAREDPLLATIVVVGLAAGWGIRGAGRAVVVGSVLFVVWLIAMGGSPMAGRDLTGIFVAAILLLARRLNAATPRLAAAAVCGVVAVSVLAPTQTFASDARYGAAFRRTARTHDARAEDYQATGLLLAVRGGLMPQHPEATRARQLAGAGERVATTSKPGFFGAAAGPGVYVLESGRHGRSPAGAAAAGCWRPLVVGSGAARAGWLSCESPGSRQRRRRGTARAALRRRAPRHARSVDASQPHRDHVAAGRHRRRARARVLVRPRAPDTRGREGRRRR